MATRQQSKAIQRAQLMVDKHKQKEKVQVESDKLVQINQQLKSMSTRKK